MHMHTPGPWRSYEPVALDYRPQHITNGESLVAVCAGGGPKRAIIGSEERANARLIAAAPDLLAILAEMLADSDDVDEGKLPRISAATIVRARQIIAKATQTSQPATK